MFMKYKGDEEWVESDNAVAKSWILVVLADEEINECKENNTKKITD